MFRTALALIVVACSSCALLKPRESFWSATATQDEIRLDWLECKKDNDAGNLTEVEQNDLAKSCMKKKGYKLLATEEAERRDQQGARH